jgi:hypothetical protein
MNYPRFQRARDDFYASRSKRFDDPLKQAVYDQDTEDLYKQLIGGIVGSGTNESSSVERALAFNEFGPGVAGQEVPASYGLGGKRKMGKGEKLPEGSFTLAKFPGVEHQIWAMEAGFIPKGYHWSSYLNESPAEKSQREKLQKQAANYQRGLLDMDIAPKRGWRHRGR